MDLAEDFRRLGIRVLRVLDGSALTAVLARQMALEGRGNPVLWPKAALEASASLLLNEETRKAAKDRNIDPDELALALSDAAIDGVLNGWLRLPGREERMGVVAQRGDRIFSLVELKVAIGEVNDASRGPRPKDKAGKALRADAEKTAFDAAKTFLAAFEHGDLRAAGYFMKEFLENASDDQLDEYLTGKAAERAGRYRFAIVESRRRAKLLRRDAMLDPDDDLDPEAEKRIEEHRAEIDAFPVPEYGVEASTISVGRGLFSRIGTDESWGNRIRATGRIAGRVAAALAATTATATALIVTLPFVSVPAGLLIGSVALTSLVGARLMSEKPKRDDIENDDTVVFGAPADEEKELTDAEVAERWFWRPFFKRDAPIKPVDKSKEVKELVESRPYSQPAQPQATVHSPQQRPTQAVPPQHRQPSPSVPSPVEADEEMTALLQRVDEEERLRHETLRNEAAELIGNDDGESKARAHGFRILHGALGKPLAGQGRAYDSDYTTACRAIARVRTGDDDVRFTPSEVRAISEIRKYNARKAIDRNETFFMTSMDAVVGPEKAAPFSHSHTGPDRSAGRGG